MRSPSTAPVERIDKYAAALILGVTPRVVARLALTGKLAIARPAKPAREWTFDAGGIREYLRQKEIEACQGAQRLQKDAIGAGHTFGAASLSVAASIDGRLTQTIRNARKHAAALVRQSSRL